MPPITHRPGLRPLPASAPLAPPSPTGSVTPVTVRTATDRAATYDTRATPTTQPPTRPVPDPELDILTRTMKAKGHNVVDVMPGPTASTATSVVYEFGANGRVLQPGEVIMLGVPPEWRKRLVYTVTLAHRQDAGTDRGLDAATGRDEKPGLTAVNLHSADDGTWRAWKAPWGSSGAWGAKFAEQRAESDPEFESMFEWNIHGHFDAEKDNGRLKNTLRPNGIRVANVGDDPVTVHKLIVDFIGQRPTELMEHVFSPGTVFGDWDTGDGRAFGGGQAFRGTYPGALAIGAAPSHGQPALPDGWTTDGGQLAVALPPGKVITGVDLACGDTKPDGLRNKDGGWGTSGKSRLSMGIRDAQGQVKWFVDRIGSPPQGVLSGSPAEKDYVTRPGDSLVFRTEVDPVYIMGLRVGFKDNAG